jgi:hypothetical protein
LAALVAAEAVLGADAAERGLMVRRKSAGRGNWLPTALVLLWLAAGLAVYYAFHRPFGPQFAVGAALAARDISLTGLLFAAAAALGTRLLPKLPAPALARLAARAAAGLGALGLLYLLVGSTAGTSAWVAWALLAALLFWLRRELAAWWQDASGFATLWRSSGALGRTIAVLSAVIFAAALAVALAPPLRFDALVYHLSLPRAYLTAGQVGYVAEVTHWGFPQLAHMLITWAGALGAGRGALVAWGMGLLTVVGLLGQLSAHLGARRAWVAVAALLCGGSLAAALSSAYVDWPSLLMAWAVLLFLDLWLQKRSAAWVIWAGVFCGLAFGAKYTAGIVAPLAALAVLWAGRRDRSAVARLLGAALLVALPWLVRNALYTGNPFYPLLLPGGEMDALRLSYYNGFAPQGNWLDAVLLPVRATFAGIESGRVGDAPGYETSLGPLLLMFGILALLPAGERPQTRSLKRRAVVIALGGLLIWAIAGRLTGHLIRSHLYFSLFAAFSVLAAFGFAASERLRIGRLRVGRIAAAVACLALGLNALQSAIAVVDSGALQLWSGAISEQDYSERNLGLYAIVISEMPTDGRTLMLWETRGYACLPACDPDEVIDRWSHDLAVYGSQQAMFSAWRAAGFDYVLYYRLGAQFVHADPEHFHAFDLDAVETGLTQLPVVRDFNGDYVLFTLSQ